MTRIYNAERGFKDDSSRASSRAYPRYLRRVPGASAVMATDAPISGQVSVITGGGSGHYPAFAGLVGPGLCHGAVVGDVFTSPSAAQAVRAIEALDGGAGVLLTFGNYSGDVMHFGLAAEQARAAGIDTRIVLVTDDVASAPADQAARRRGIAGGFFVFRAAASSARRGDDLEGVERVAQHANERTRTFGIALAGCTFPGRTEPLFTIEPGTIALGLGIHGEPGIETVDWVPARDLAGILLDPLLRERPGGASRARVLLNGLGSSKYEELFVLYRSVHERLLAAGVEPVDVEVGEFVTSLDMAGCSLTLCWLDEQLEALLSTPAADPRVSLGDPRSRTPDDPCCAGDGSCSASVHDRRWRTLRGSDGRRPGRGGGARGHRGHHRRRRRGARSARCGRRGWRPWRGHGTRHRGCGRRRRGPPRTPAPRSARPGPRSPTPRVARPERCGARGCWPWAACWANPDGPRGHALGGRCPGSARRGFPGHPAPRRRNGR